MQRRASLVQGLCASFALSQLVLAGCAQPASGGGSGGSNGNGGSQSGNGGSTARGGSNGSGNGGSNGSGNGGSNGSGNGGSNGSGNGGSVTTGTGGSNGSGNGGSNGSGNGGSNGSGNGGSNTGTGGSSTGLAGNSGTRACGAPASGDVIADFEEGKNQNVAQGMRQGWWSAFGDSAGTQIPAGGATAGPAAAVTAPLPAGDTCDMFAFHSTATGHSATSDSSYVGFSGSFNAVLPPPSGTTSKTQNPYDVSAYDGVSFNIKSGSGTAPPVWVEFQNTENVPSPDGTAKYDSVDKNNTRGMLLSSIGTSWTKVFVPFAILAPRYLPSTTSTDCSNGNVVCQAPPWDSKNTLKLQFGIYPQFAVAPFTSSPTLNYDLWVDDVAFYKGADGLGTWASSAGTMHAFPVDSAKVGSCTKPAGATGKDLIQAYLAWKKKFVTGSGSSTRVIRPENQNDTVSEGIGYGMLIAVNMGDKDLFDGLWSYAGQHAEGGKGTLMTWCLPSGGGGTGSPSSPAGGTATDADEDMAFALLQASKQWSGGNYLSDATKLIGYIWQYDIDQSAKLPSGGSNLVGQRTNPSYWAPAYYRAFAKVDSNDWATVANNSYTALNAIAAKSTGAAAGALVPAWCSGTNCGNVDGGSYTDGGVYQYDAHRVAWRFGLDACWNGTSSGSGFLTKNAGFFANIAKTGIGRVVDIYALSGTPNSDAAPNSMSIVGTAGVGAMAVGSSFADTAWQFLLDASYSPSSMIPDKMGRVGYTYFNATVGLLTALTLSGNFNNF